MFDNLSEKLERSFKLLKGQGKITEINVAETLKEVRRALIDADVEYKVAKQFVDTVKAKAMGANVINALKPSELMVKIVHDVFSNDTPSQKAYIRYMVNDYYYLKFGKKLVQSAIAIREHQWWSNPNEVIDTVFDRLTN